MIKLNPLIENKQAIDLLGMNEQTSIVNDKTAKLWRTFKPYLVQNIDDSTQKDWTYYDIQVYAEDYFKEFSPTKNFIKWAAIERKDNLTKNLTKLKKYTIPSGIYAGFKHIGTAASIRFLVQEVYQNWLLLNGHYQLDESRPHFMHFDHKYNPNADDAIEWFWVPIK